MKLAWDALGSEYASRPVQDEMFHSGPRTTTTAMAYGTCDWDTAGGMLDRQLDSIPSPAVGHRQAAE